MHMSDALLSPVVGAGFWAVSAGLLTYATKKISDENDDRAVPLMGVTGAFVFAAQMINFAIPGTGSSGHLGGGLLLAILLGPYRAFLVLSSVLTVQALLFADGGLLALGCNVFNLAFFPAFIAYPFIWRRIAGTHRRGARAATAAVVAAVAGLVMGSGAVVLQTVLSGISDLPFTTFTAFMIPIHVAIGVVEGLVTWGVVRLVEQVSPGMLDHTVERRPIGRAVSVLAVLALVVGGSLSWFASANPDGLEWSLEKATDTATLEPRDAPLYHRLAAVQEKIAALPDYALPSAEEEALQPPSSPVNLGTSLSGVVGALVLTLIGVGLGLLTRSVSRNRRAAESR